jgi:hypothetical protein
MKKVNFRKLGKQFLAGLFGVALMCGVMLNTQTAEAQSDEYIAAASYFFGLIKTKPKCAHNATQNANAGSIICKGTYCEMTQGLSGANYNTCG